MSSDTSDVLTELYSDRIREPRTSDEVYGYWLFTAGVLLGLLALALVIGSEVNTNRRGFGIAIAGLALLAVLYGSVVRLEFRDVANRMALAGVVVGVAAIAWFWLAYPDNWQHGTAQVWNVVGLGAAGIALIVIAAVVVPLVTDTGSQSQAAAVAAAEAGRQSAEADAARSREDLVETQAGLADAEAGIAEAEADLAEFAESLAQFELYEDAAGEYRWRLRHRNGNVIADGGEGYSSRQKAQQGIQSVKVNAYGAAVADLEPLAVDVDSVEEHVDGADAAPMVTEADSRATFETYEDAGGEYRWRLRHDNGEIVADGGEGYASRSNVADAVDRVRHYAPTAAYLRVDPTAFELYRDAAAEWRWRLIHENGTILADSGEGYSGRMRCRQGAESVAANVGPDGDAEFEVYENNRGDYGWRLRHANGNIIADSGEGYASKSGAEDAVDRVREYAPEADLLVVGDAAFEIFEDRSGEWRWHLRHRNGNVLADSGQGYGGRSRATEAVTRVKRHATGADTAEVAE